MIFIIRVAAWLRARLPRQPSLNTPEKLLFNSFDLAIFFKIAIIKKCDSLEARMTTSQTISQLVFSKIQTENAMTENDILSALRLLYPTLIIGEVFTFDRVIGDLAPLLSPSPELGLSADQIYACFFNWLKFNIQDLSDPADAGALSFLRSYSRLHYLVKSRHHEVRCRYEWERDADPRKANLFVALLMSESGDVMARMRLVEPIDDPANTATLDLFYLNALRNLSA